MVYIIDTVDLACEGKDVYCLGCGCEMSKPGDRRALHHPATEDVASLWKMFIKNEAKDQQICDGVNFETILRAKIDYEHPKYVGNASIVLES